jgi:hypothetical protein
MAHVHVVDKLLAQWTGVLENGVVIVRLLS